MAKIVILCPRSEEHATVSEAKMGAIFRRITPDNLTPDPPLIRQENGVLVAIFNPKAGAHHLDQNCASIGVPYAAPEDYGNPGKAVPDGSFALFRFDRTVLEAVTDAGALRTIWYLQTPSLFLAATSQRVLIHLLGSFEPDLETIPWVLTTGCLGPHKSWDRRIRRLQPGERLTLQRQDWTVSFARRRLSFNVPTMSDSQHVQALKKELLRFFDGSRLELDKWILPISGGYDSRFLLLCLKDRPELRCITWGEESTLKDPHSDAYLARELTQHFRRSHQFYPTDRSLESKSSAETVLDRFMTASEGRTDTLVGYADGMQIWQTLFEAGVVGVMRGTEAFGWPEVATAYDVRRQVLLRTIGDFPNLRFMAEQLRAMWGEQEIPAAFRRESTETLAAWRDRVFVEHLCAVLFAGLADNILTYVEMLHPYMVWPVLEAIFSLPDHLRSDKRAFRTVVESVSPPIPFARRQATAYLEDLFQKKAIVELLKDELTSSHARTLLSNELVDFIVANMAVAAARPAKKKVLVRRVQALMPAFVRNALRNTVAKEHLDPNRLAFRAYTVSRMHRTLKEDASSCWWEKS